MTRNCKILTVLLGALLLPVLHAQAGDDGIEDAEFDVRREFPRATHPGETTKFREIGIGDWGLAWNFYYTARSYNISDISGLDNSLASSWLYSFDPWGVGARAHVEHRLSHDWRLSFMPRADAAFGILNTTYPNSHELTDLPFRRNYRGANDSQKLSLNVEFEFAVRWRYLWFVNKFNSWMVFRRREIRAYDTAYRDPQLGTLSGIEDRERVDWEQAYVFGMATGIGFEFYFLPEAARFTLFALWRPFNHVSFRERSSVTNGIEVMARSTDFELTDQIGVYFELAMQLYLPTDEFNDIYYTQFAIGVKFR